MKTIYKAPMRKLVVSKLEIKDGVVQLLEYDTPILRRDLLFYKNRLNTYISLDYGTRLANEEEAMDYVRYWIETSKRDEAPYPSCPFVDDREMEVHNTMDSSNFKALKKYYKSLRREDNKKKK